MVIIKINVILKAEAAAKYHSVEYQNLAPLFKHSQLGKNCSTNTGHNFLLEIGVKILKNASLTPRQPTKDWENSL